MEYSSAVDLDSLLQSQGEIDSDEEHSSLSIRHHRTVDEILLNHSSSSSPSPPSSPSNSQFLPLKDDDGDYGSTSFSYQRLSHSQSSSFVESGKYNSAASFGSNSNRTKYGGRVLPQLFANGAIRSNAKPGAALAAAAAASRSIPTPHATAIKLRRATTADVLQRSISETTEKVTSDASSPSAVISRVSENDSDAEIYLKRWSQDEDVILEQIHLGNTNSDSTQTDEGGKYPAEERHLENCDEVAEVSTNCKTLTETSEDEISPTCRNRSASTSESEKDLPSDETNVTGQVLSPLLDEKNEEYLEACATDESDGNDIVGGPSPTLNVVLHTEDVAGGVEKSDLGDAVGEPGSGNYISMQSEVAVLEDLVSLREREVDCTNLLQKPDSSLKLLDLAEEIERKQASTGLHYEEGAAAQPMRLEGVQRGSTVLGYFDVNSNNVITQTISSQPFLRDHGCAQVVAVHFNYIAVGMSKGSIFVVPSKYTSHLVDNMDTQMISLGLQGDRSHIPVTSMCFNQQGELLFAGYGDGHYTVWDVQKAKALKVVTEHRAPVVHMLYMGQDTQVTRQFNVVSGDSKGVVKLISFSVVPWVNMISYTKPMKLLDETTSRVICASPLLYGEGHGGTIISSQSNSAVSTSSVSGMMGGMVDGSVVIFITHQSALVAKVIPTVDVYAQIPKPDGIREGAMPYAAWRCMSQSLGSPSENAHVETSDKVSLLAIAWDREIWVAKLLKSKLKVLEKWTLESEAIGLAWLGEEMLVILTMTAQLCLFTKDGNLIHQTSFSGDGFRRDDLISHHIYFSNSLGNPEKAYHNSVAVRGATIYILGQEHLIISRLLSWKERIEVLRKAGDWMGALNMAMALYDGQSHGVVDLPKNLADIQMIVMPYLVELLQAYVGEVFSYISVACNNQNENLDQSNEIKEQYIRVGGVAVEFCVHVKRTDILFDDILSKFDEAHQKETFLELLEPYILKDMLGSLPPEIMQALVEHYSKRGWLQRIEQCVLHMDILSLDFNQVVRLCREHSLHCALIYLFNKGLDDFKTPLEELLLVLRESARENATSLGYRMLVYLKYCFHGLAFPPGRGNLSPMRLPSLRKELLHFLLEDCSAPNSWAATSLLSNGSYANVLHLLQLDTQATLVVLGCAFTDIGHPKSTDSSQESNNFNRESAESENLIQRMVDVLADILDACYLKTGSAPCRADVDSVEVWPSKKDVEHMFDFIAYYVAYGQANVSRDILSHILEYLTSDVNASDTTSGETIEIFKQREKHLLSLIQVVPETQWDAPYLLHLSAKAQFHQVCGYIHSICQQYIAAMDSYMKATQEPIYAFSFIYDMLRLLNDEESDAFESAVISRIPNLLKLSREGTYFLIVDHFSEKMQYILSELQSYPESLFLYLKTVVEVHVTGTLNISSLKKFDFPKARRAQLQSNGVQAYLEEISISQKLLPNNQVNVTDEMMELYFELLCRYDHKSVLKFLETSESYRVEHCLRLCQEYGIIDAASFLLERVGEVGSALQLILSNLGDKLIVLDAEIQKASCNTIVDNLDAVLKKKVVAEILDIVHACIGLCQRNSPRLQPEESEYLWFQLLDSFCEPLMDSRNARTGPDREAVKDTFDESIGQSDEAKGHKMKWKPSKSRKGARMIRKLFSIFIKEIVEGMIGFVRLPRIMMKLLSDNGNQEFGDFKPTILGMLGTYDFERKILDTARSLIEDDTYYTMSLLRKGASHGYAPRSLVCCICNSFLSKYSTDSSIQVFSCGHAMHLHCQLEENRASARGTLVGCPICIPRKKAQKSSGKSSMLSENGLVSSSPSLMQQAHGSSPSHPHIHETADNSYGLNPTSRFELLHNLEKDERWAHIENTPQLRLAPPALYHEKVKKGIHVIAEESSSSSSNSRVLTRDEKPRSRQLKDVKVKRSSARFPLKSNIFGKVKTSRR